MRRDRAARSPLDPFLHQHAFAELVDRLRDVRRSFDHALLIGCVSPGWAAELREVAGRVTVSDPSTVLATRCGGVAADEDRLPFADASFDLVVATGTLDGLDDLPGALTLMRRLLRPDGLLLAAMAGANSLPRLRRAMLAADAVAGGAAARLHPGLDLRTAGDLLARAGYALPVADAETLDVSYAGLPTLIADLRAHGGTNILVRRPRSPLDRRAYAAACADFTDNAADGRTIEKFEILHLSGWSPAPSQPRPARPGSGVHSLADALIQRSS